MQTADPLLRDVGELLDGPGVRAEDLPAQRILPLLVRLGHDRGRVVDHPAGDAGVDLLLPDRRGEPLLSIACRPAMSGGIKPYRPFLHDGLMRAAASPLGLVAAGHRFELWEARGKSKIRLAAWPPPDDPAGRFRTLCAFSYLEEGLQARIRCEVVPELGDLAAGSDVGPDPAPGPGPRPGPVGSGCPLWLDPQRPGGRSGDPHGSGRAGREDPEGLRPLGGGARGGPQGVLRGPGPRRGPAGDRGARGGGPGPLRRSARPADGQGGCRAPRGGPPPAPGSGRCSGPVPSTGSCPTTGPTTRPGGCSPRTGSGASRPRTCSPGSSPVAAGRGRSPPCPGPPRSGGSCRRA